MIRACSIDIAWYEQFRCYHCYECWTHITQKSNWREHRLVGLITVG